MDAPEQCRCRETCHVPHIAWCVTAVLTWLVVFAIGYSVPAKPFVEEIIAGPSFWRAIFNILAITLSASLLNVPILCCIAALMGGTCNPKVNEVPQHLFAKGLLVYLAFLASSTVVGTNLFGSPSQADYVKMVSITSLMSFVIGYFPEKFEKLLGRAASSTDRFLDDQQNGNRAGQEQKKT